MKNGMKKGIALLLSMLFVLSIGSVGVFAAQDTASEPKISSFEQTYANLGKGFMDGVFVITNDLAGCKEDWSREDGEVYSIKYGERGCQGYDLYIPAGLDNSKPVGVILFIHGGTWSGGSRDNFTWACRRYAKHGYITATLDYDVADQGEPANAIAYGAKPGATVADMLEDIDLCIKNLKSAVKKHGYTPAGLALVGESAGSHFAMMYGYSRPQDSAIPIKCLLTITAPVSWRNGTFDNYSPEECVGYINMIAGSDITAEQYKNPDAETEALLHSISPVDYINKDSVPTFMGFAGKDTTIGTNQYQTIKPVLDENGVPNDVVWWTKSNHALYSDPGVLDNEWTPKSLQWLATYLGGQSR